MKKAMIFAAGLGTRLKPLTDNKPKALVELNGKTMLQRAVEKLVRASVSRIVINIHHYPELMRHAVEQLKYPGVEFIISDETDQLFDTGGGLLKAVQWLEGEEPVIVHNVDVISDIDLNEMVQAHVETKALATLAACSRPTTRHFLWHKNRLCGWQNTQTGQQIFCCSTPQEPIPLGFNGIHIISPRLFPMITETGCFPINHVYLRLAAAEKICSFIHDPEYWADIGTMDKLAHAESLIRKYPEKY
jgi:NDP-sugar pyrophosphorylase family protein